SSENQNKTKLKKISQSTYKPILNPKIFEENFRNQVRTAFTNGNVKNGEPVNHNNAVCSSQPFPYCIINDFLCLPSNSTTDTEPANSFLLELKEQLLKLNFNPKSNDLYQFAQTSELIGKPGINGANESSLLRHVVTLLHHKLLPWLRDTTTIKLNDDVDMFCAQYKETDYLLCHDDELENRRIAYVYYLSPDWSINDGGALQLFNSNQREYNGSAIFDPSSVIHEIVPKFNSLVLFEVCPTSYHQVAEIITSTKTRLSLTGWFHGPTEPRPHPDHQIRDQS
uniref:Fe2OG dioxygenase domain-containing protein n=1 Tax=Ciona savignyi TaxID=51511 RepID=H2YMJ6_CIOSA